MGNFYKTTIHSIYNDRVKGVTRIVMISDIHISENTKEEVLDNIVRKISTYKPDYICIPGDLIDYAEVIEDLRIKKMTLQFLNNLSSLCPVILSIGNHDFSAHGDKDWVCYYNKDFFGEVGSINGLTLVDNDSFFDGKVFISGYSQPFDFYFNSSHEDTEVMKKDLEKLKNITSVKQYETPRICLIHSPLRLDESDINVYFKDYDLLMSGHMHEGIMPPILDEIIPGNRGLIAPSKFLFPKNARGIVKLENNYLVISGGIVKFSSSAPKICQIADCFFPMSINVIDLSNAFEKDVNFSYSKYSSK